MEGFVQARHSFYKAVKQVTKNRYTVAQVLLKYEDSSRTDVKDEASEFLDLDVVLDGYRSGAAAAADSEDSFSSPESKLKIKSPSEYDSPSKEASQFENLINTLEKGHFNSISPKLDSLAELSKRKLQQNQGNQDSYISHKNESKCAQSQIEPPSGTNPDDVAENNQEIPVIKTEPEDDVPSSMEDMNTTYNETFSDDDVPPEYDSDSDAVEDVRPVPSGFFGPPVPLNYSGTMNPAVGDARPVPSGFFGPPLPLKYSGMINSQIEAMYPAVKPEAGEGGMFPYNYPPQMQPFPVNLSFVPGMMPPGMSTPMPKPREKSETKRKQPREKTTPMKRKKRSKRPDYTESKEDLELRNNSGVVFTEFRCMLCSDEIDHKSWKSLKEHFITVHYKEKDEATHEVECLKPGCSKTFFHEKKLVRLDGLLYHMYFRHNIGYPWYVKVFPCPIEGCTITHVSKPGISCHLRNAHYTRKKTKVVCDQCGVSLTCGSLYLHKKHHCKAIHEMSEKQHKCKDCPKTYVTEQGLTNHVQRRHTGQDQPNICQFCSYQAFSPLTDHLWKIHDYNPESLPIFQCPTCQYQSLVRKTFSAHMTRQHGNKLYTCNFCLETFKNRSTYFRHTETHSDTVHQCPQCEYSTKHRSQLKQHMNAQHSDRRFNCNFCAYSSGYRENTLKHMKLCTKKHGV